ncbi:MAG: hypothetical protein ACKERG_00060 [Candidatus Hodgkinia cicadicola]
MGEQTAGRGGTEAKTMAAAAGRPPTPHVCLRLKCWGLRPLAGLILEATALCSVFTFAY